MNFWKIRLGQIRPFWAGYSKIDTGHPVIVAVIIPEMIYKKAALIPLEKELNRKAYG
jgi:hypothetical protein